MAKSEMARKARRKDKKARAGEGTSKDREGGRARESPRRETMLWSEMAVGLVRKRKDRVRWKREREVRIVREDIRAMVEAGFERLALALGQMIWTTGDGGEVW